MAVKLRLRRMGRKKRPFYRVIAADSRAPRDGKFIEEIGYYNPLTDPATIEIKEDRALYWLGVGAKPTPTVKSLLRKKGIILKFHLKKQGLPEEKIDEELKKWEVLQLEKQRRLEAAKMLEKEAAKKTETESQPEVGTESTTTDTLVAKTESENPSEEIKAEQDNSVEQINEEKTE